MKKLKTDEAVEMLRKSVLSLDSCDKCAVKDECNDKYICVHKSLFHEAIKIENEIDTSR